MCVGERVGEQVGQVFGLVILSFLLGLSPCFEQPFSSPNITGPKHTFINPPSPLLPSFPPSLSPTIFLIPTLQPRALGKLQIPSNHKGSLPITKNVQQKAKTKTKTGTDIKPILTPVHPKYTLTILPLLPFSLTPPPRTPASRSVAVGPVPVPVSGSSRSVPQLYRV